MSTEESMSATHDCGGDAAAYVLGALEPDEAARFRAHMEGCVVCRDEVTTFQQVADALPLAAPHHDVPRALRRRVLRQVHEEARTAQASKPRRTFTIFRPAWAGALAGGIAVVVAVVIAVGGGGSSTHTYVSSIGQARVRVSGGHAELVVDHLPQPASGDIYEVWLERDGGEPQPTKALFSVTQSGAADIGVPGDVRGVSTVMVTEEPAGGSPTPTTSPVIKAHI
jgi:anti-sigma-K factor RskA